MKSLKFLALFAVLAVAVAEPPRRRANNFKAFARQEGAPEGENPPPAPADGYKYDAPQGEQLRLPTRFTAQFKLGRQQEETTPSTASGGYHYPKPTDSYGPPEERTDQPDTEYGTPDDATTVSPDDEQQQSTDEPQAERLRGFNRKSAKLTRLQVSQKIRSQPTKARVQLQQQQQQPQQPIFYVVNTLPVAEYVQPQLEYYYVLNKWVAWTFRTRGSSTEETLDFEVMEAQLYTCETSTSDEIYKLYMKYINRIKLKNY